MLYCSSLKLIFISIFQSACTSKLKWCLPFKVNNFPIWSEEMYYICKDELNVSKKYSWHLLEWDTFKSKRQLCVRSRADPKFFGGTKQPLWPFPKISRALPYLQVNSHESYQYRMYSHIYCGLLYLTDEQKLLSVQVHQQEKAASALHLFATI